MKRALPLAIVALGCNSAPPQKPTVALPVVTSSASASAPTLAVAPASGGAPLVINGRVIEPAIAATLRTFAGIRVDATAVPLRDGSGRFVIGEAIVDPVSGATVGHTRLARLEATDLVREEPTGALRWKRALPGVRSVRSPDVVVAGGMVVASVDGKLQAFDDLTGKPRWSAPGPADRLATDGTHVFTTDCTSGTVAGRALVATRLADGKPGWRQTIAADSDPDAIELDPAHVIVRDASHKATSVFDHAGKLLYRLAESVQSTYMLPRGLVVFTDKRVALYDDAGTQVWTRAPLAATFVSGNDVVAVGGDLVIGNFGEISDSGVDVVRLDGTSGALVWGAKVPGLGVGHSQYLHVAYLEVRGPKLYVVSQGLGGSFYERLDLATGVREARCSPAAGTCGAPR